MTRAQRNNNPGNIDRGKAEWLGEDRSKAALEHEPRFCVFKTPAYGYRALARLLRAYQTRHGLNTVRMMIDRWAPPVENDTSAYVLDVAGALHVDPDHAIDTHDHATLFALCKAIARHESGFDPWADSVVEQGVNMALSV